MTTPKLKTATQTAPATRKAGIDAAKAAPKGSKIAAMAKAHAATPTRKAPANEQVNEQGKRIGAMHALITGLNTRVEALETQSALNESRIAEAFENMTKVIANLQLTLASMNTVRVPVSRDDDNGAVVEARKPSSKARKEAPANSERGTYDGPAVDGPADDVLAYLAERVIVNAEAGFLNENIAKVPMNANRMRRYLRTAENKAFKACREAHELNMTDMDNTFDALFV